jgi:hypothetical protein
MNVEIGTEAAQFPEKEYINWIFVAVYTMSSANMDINNYPHPSPFSLMAPMIAKYQI